VAGARVAGMARRSDAMQNSRAEVGKTAELFGPAKIVPDPWV